MVGKLQFVDVAMVVVYLVLCLVIGLYKSTKIKNIKEYAVGNRNFSTFVIISTIFATYVNAGSTIVGVEGIYDLGIIFAVSLFFLPCNWFLIKNLYAKNIEQFRGCLSMSEIMGKLYGSIGRDVTSMLSIFSAIGVLSIQVTAIGFLFNYFFGFTYIEGVLIGMGILIVYSTLGGVRAVALTDVLQFLIFFIALPLVAGYAYFKTGGYERIVSSLPTSNITIPTDTNSLMLFFGFIFWLTLPAVSAPYIQRLLMGKNTKQLMTSYNILIVGSLFFPIVIFILGFSIKVLYPDIEGKMALYHFIGELSPILIGIMVIGMLAVIMSTSDSWLNSLSVIISHDIIKRIFPQINGKQELLVARIATCLSGCLAVFISLESREILSLAILLEVFFYSIILIPFTAGFLRFKTTHVSFLSGAASGIACVLVTRMLTGEFGVISLTFGVLSNAIGFFGSHYIQFPSELGVLKDKIVNNVINAGKKICKIPYKIMHMGSVFSFSSSSSMKKDFKYFITFTMVFILINIPAFMFDFDYNESEHIKNSLLYVRIISSILCVLLCMHEIWIKSKNLFYSYANFTLIFCLPFMSGYFMFINGYEGVWISNFIISSILFWILISSKDFIINYFVGIISSYFVANYVVTKWHSTSDFYYNPNLATYSSVILSGFILFTLYYIRKKNAAKEKSLEVLGRSIAHDVQSPLSTNITGVSMIRDAIEEKNDAKIKKYLGMLEKNNEVAMQDIDMLLTSLSDLDKKPRDWGEYPLLESVQSYIEDFFIEPEDMQRILVDIKDDFVFVGSKTLFKHVVLNLIKNWLKYAGKDSEISICLKDGNLHFKDNGYGIPKDIGEKLFMEYGTTGGHGIGLNFCKEAMNSMNGDIVYVDTQEGTEFVISFSST